METKQRERLWIGAMFAISGGLLLLWNLSGDRDDHRERSVKRDHDRVAKAQSNLRESESSLSPSDPTSKSRHLVGDTHGEVVGVVVSPPNSTIQPKITVTRADGADARKPSDVECDTSVPPGGEAGQAGGHDGRFRLDYERDPDLPYKLEVDAPGMRPVTVPLPDAVQDVGRIVLQPSLGYRGRVLLDEMPVPGVKVSLHGREMIRFGHSVDTTDRDGRFELRITDGNFSTLSKDNGAYTELSLGFTHPENAFKPVAAREEGFWGEHVIHLHPAAQAEFILSSGADDIPIRLERSLDRDSRTLASTGPFVHGAGRTRDGGRYRTAWPVGWNAAWVVVGAAPDEARHLVTLADLNAAQGPLTLGTASSHRFELRTTLKRAPKPNVEITLLVRSAVSPSAFGWLRGVTDDTGTLRFTLGGTGERKAGPVGIERVDALYDHEGHPHEEFFDLVKKNRGHRSARRLTLRLGRSLDEPRSVWFTCRDEAGRTLTPTRVWCLARIASGLELMLGSGLRAMPPSIEGVPGLYRVLGLALPEEGAVAAAEDAVFVVDTAEQGQERFAVGRDVWMNANSARSPLEFKFASKKSDRVEFRVVDHARVPVPRVWVTIVPLDLRPNLRTLEQIRASSDNDGVVKVHGLAPDRCFQVFAHDLRDGRTGFLKRFDSQSAPQSIVLVLDPVTNFRATLQLDSKDFTESTSLGAFLCSEPQGILPTVPCIIKGRQITAQRASGLSGYRLTVSTYHPKLRLVKVSRAADEAHGGIVPFPE